MSSVCSAVESDWSGASRINGDNNGDEGKTLRDSVHAALGNLIKARRVYYTGNKGYFLVTPEAGINNRYKINIPFDFDPNSVC